MLVRKLLPGILPLLVFLLCLILACSEKRSNARPVEEDIPHLYHDVGFIPFDAKYDNPKYSMCDSTEVASGRNRLQYDGGNRKLREEIFARFPYKQEYEGFNGYIVVRFLHNCEGISMRYRAQSLNPDFTVSSAPSDMERQAIATIKQLDHWTKSSSQDAKTEYSKYINFKFDDGKLQHVML